jgi:hypothetical protein
MRSSIQAGMLVKRLSLIIFIHGINIIKYINHSSFIHLYIKKKIL